MAGSYISDGVLAVVRSTCGEKPGAKPEPYTGGICFASNKSPVNCTNFNTSPCTSGGELSVAVLTTVALLLKILSGSSLLVANAANTDAVASGKSTFVAARTTCMFFEAYLSWVRHLCGAVSANFKKTASLRSSRCAARHVAAASGVGD